MVASGFSAQTLPAQGVDTRIQIVWAHDEMGNPAAVDRATRLNITVEVFEHGTTKAIPPNPSGRFDYVVSLWVAEGNNSIGMAKYSSVVPMTYTEKGQAYTRWYFNDVPVQPGGQYHFLAGASAVDRPGVYPHASIWTHAADARTAMPNPQEPPPCVP
jgi:hypothetical protein